MAPEFTPEKIEQEYVPEIMTWGEYAGNKHALPYVYELKKGDKELVYFGAGHSNDPSNPMFAEIKAKFDEARPDSVFIEGMDSLDEIKKNPERLAKAIAMLKGMSDEEVIKKYGEPMYGIKLAVEAGVDFYSPEPAFKDEIEHLLKKGFTKEEIFLDYVHRQVYQYYRNKEERPIEEYLQGSIIQSLKEAAGWQDFDYSLEHLAKLSQETWGEKGDIRKPDYSSERTDPTADTEFKTRITAAAQESSAYRDVHMVKELRDALKTHNRPFVIFGASHAYMQRPALEKLFS